MGHKIRRQHFVWRRYLREWSDKEEQIWCHRDGKIFKSNLMGIAQKRDFYKVQELTTEEEQFLIYLTRTPDSATHIKEIHQQFLNLFKRPFDSRRFLESINDQEKVEKINIGIHNLEELLQRTIENTGATFLNKILNEDTSFYSNGLERMQFSIYISMQYFRTQEMKRRMFLFAENSNELNVEKFAPYMRAIFSTNIAINIAEDPKIYKIVLLRNNTELDFITGDQPVLNTCASYEKNTPVHELEFYYPISPKLSILLTNNADQKDTSLSIHEVDHYNNLIRTAGNNIIFSSSKEILKAYYPNSKIFLSK
ncbi:DUF4238 domain-containing protein [Halobacteriovorax sp. GFR7]|uniref:DUF4238 domain-containing protein n=1 Tax=unclassified Halobacteriovorax TaxID=2639665 RepID=UPI003D966EE6